MTPETVVEDIQDYAQNIVDTVREPLLILDATLRVRSANRAFYQTFHVSPTVTEGRLIYELGNGQWDIPDLRTLLEDIVPTSSVFDDFELEHTFPVIGRRVMLLNARKLQAGHHGELLVLAMEDVTERRRSEANLKAIETYAQNIVDTVREPLLILDTTLRVRSANRAFYQTFHVSAGETEGRLIYELGNGQWDIPALRMLLEDIVPKSSVFDDFELEHTFPVIGRRVMLLNARKLQAGHHGELLVLAMEDVTERRHITRDLEIARRRLELDLELARRVQRGFLPPGPPEIPGYESFAFYESAYEIGGDYYDFIPLPGQRIAVLLGDVAGKGVAAALLMAKLGADARFCMLTEPDPALAVSKLNAMMHVMEQSAIVNRFVTLVAAILDPANHTVTLVNAGHPPPLIYRRTTRSVSEAISNDVAGFPLGVVEGFEYASCLLSLDPGDSILAFTDGVTEAMDTKNVQLRTKGVRAAVRGAVGEAHSPRQLCERVVQVVKQFANGRSQQDDIALVGFGRTG